MYITLRFKLIENSKEDLEILKKPNETPIISC